MSLFDDNYLTVLRQNIQRHAGELGVEVQMEDAQGLKDARPKRPCLGQSGRLGALGQKPRRLPGAGLWKAVAPGLGRQELLRQQDRRREGAVETC